MPGASGASVTAHAPPAVRHRPIPTASAPPSPDHDRYVPPRMPAGPLLRGSTPVTLTAATALREQRAVAFIPAARRVVRESDSSSTSGDELAAGCDCGQCYRCRREQA